MLALHRLGHRVAPGKADDPGVVDREGAGIPAAGNLRRRLRLESGGGTNEREGLFGCHRAITRRGPEIAGRRIRGPPDAEQPSPGRRRWPLSAHRHRLRAKQSTCARFDISPLASPDLRLMRIRPDFLKALPRHWPRSTWGRGGPARSHGIGARLNGIAAKSWQGFRGTPDVTRRPDHRSSGHGGRGVRR